MPECKDTACPLVPRIEALERDAEHNKDAHKDFYTRLEASHTSVAVIEQKLVGIKDDTTEIRSEQAAMNASIEELKAKPAKRWDGIVEKIILAVVTAVVAFMLARVGL